MVTSTKLKSELSEFNKKLDRHLKDVDLDELDNSFSSSKSGDYEDSENAMLLVENLKDIRYELNSMRKNLSSDVSSMVSKELNSLKSDFFDKLFEANSEVFSKIKSIDFDSIKTMNDSLEDIRNKQLEHDRVIQSLQEDMDRKITNLNTHEEKRFNSYLDELKKSQDSLNQRLKEFEKRFSGIEKEVSSKSLNSPNNKKLIQNLQKNISQKIKDIKTQEEEHINKNLEEIQTLHSDLSKKIQAFEDKISLNGDKINNLNEKEEQNLNSYLNGLYKSHDDLTKKIQEFENKFTNMNKNISKSDKTNKDNMSKLTQEEEDRLNSFLKELYSSHEQLTKKIEEIESQIVNLKNNSNQKNINLSNQVNSTAKESEAPQENTQVNNHINSTNNNSYIELNDDNISVEGVPGENYEYARKILTIDQKLKRIENLR